MSQRCLVWLPLIALLQLLCLSVLAHAQTCNASPSYQLKALTDKEFFASPIGSVALGEGCNERNRICPTYYDFSNCTDITFPVALSGTANRLFVVFNTMNSCQGDCEWVDSFLQFGVLYPPDAAKIAYRPFIDLVRNYSDRWGIYGGSGSRLRCCEQPNGMLLPEDYMAFDARGAAEYQLFTATGLAWHSVFAPSYRQAGAWPNVLFPSALSASDGQDDLTTWSQRGFLLNKVIGCPGCSAKLMMTRFQETEAADTVLRPSVPLFQGFDVMTYSRIMINSHAPLADDIYDRAVDIELLR